jgi:mannose-6-phosphate isomerase-like protein (cupin superfamily)
MAVLPHTHNLYDPINTRSDIPGARIITAGTCGATQMELWEQYMPPGGEIPRHYHDCEESLTFLSGEVEVTLGEERHRIGADTTVFVPEGALHGVRNVGDVPVRLIAVFTRAAPAILYPDAGVST